MGYQILMNFIVAIVWTLLQDEVTATRFIIGWIIGMLVLIPFRRMFIKRLYLYRVWAIIDLTLIFLREVLIANFTMAKMVLSPKLEIKPGFFAYPLEIKHEVQITVLAGLICLTPGTISVDVSDDNSTLYVHAIHLPECEKTIEDIKNLFEKRILEVAKS
ncbi:cation:proton antiporter [Desulfuribacillus stibiiarsenatis]|uniref:Cation:proton antiporter n=1 Tax=Desulfuribacillus stibiiarsenatis TaxID=1390249 RepID=A0A1E5L3E6_9FIRM|nr:Na+/H+ antiporter subunit E [Desulfuribacillus stibiiarsenatis]OEH84583.1 cation:proton antiporter [Desulfuribacillus stibiiarsenatis]